MNNYKKNKTWLVALAAGLMGVTSAQASDVGVTFDAAGYDFESNPADDNIIRNMGTKVGYIKSAGSSAYMGYTVPDLAGATHLKVRAASGSKGGTLTVRLATHYQSVHAPVATVEIPNTGGFDAFQDFFVPVDQATISELNGRTLFLVVDDSSDDYLFDLESFEFIASDVDVTINAVDFDFESAPADDGVILDMGTKVGYIKSAGSPQYMVYENFDFGSGAAELTVRAASDTNGGTLTVRLATHYQSVYAPVATIQIPNTGGWDNFQDFTVPVDQATISALNGRSLFLVVDDSSSDYLFDIESFRFNSVPSNDVGYWINAASFDGESAPGDDDVIRDMGDKVGYIKSTGSSAYMTYDSFDFGSGATELTVRASSGAAQGGTLTVRLATHYQSIHAPVATIQIPNTGGWDNFQDFTVPVDQATISALNGRTLFLVVEGPSDYQFDIKSFRFDQ